MEGRGVMVLHVNLIPASGTCSTILRRVRDIVEAVVH